MPRGGTSHADAVAACLRNGRWAPRPGGPRSVASLEDESWIHKYKCQDLRMTVERNQWTPDDPRCNELLELDYKTARFDGLFADPERPIEYSMVAESIAETISVGLKHVLAANPNLLGLTAVNTTSDTPSLKEIKRLMSPINIAAMPSDPNGTRRVFELHKWRSDVPKSRRFLLAMSANWYNLAPTDKQYLDNLLKSANHPPHPRHDVPWLTPCPTFKYGKGGAEPEVCGPSMHKPKGSHNYAPCKTPDGCVYGSTQWGWYPWTRRGQGSLTAVDYKHDLAALVTAANEYSDAQVVWVEGPPQHCSAECLAALHPLNPSATVRDVQASRNWSASCSSWPYFGGLNWSHVAANARRLVCPQQAQLDIDAETPAAGCVANISRWRYQVASSVLEGSGLPVVPLENALKDRWHLHTDCTHWCSPSEASVHMVMALLNMLAALVRDSHGGHHNGGGSGGHGQSPPAPPPRGPRRSHSHKAFGSGDAVRWRRR